MSFDKVLVSWHDDRIGACVPLESVVYGLEIFSNFDWSMFRMISVEYSICCQYEEKISIVPCEIFVAEIVGKIIAEVRPHGNINVGSEIYKEIRE